MAESGFVIRQKAEGSGTAHAVPCLHAMHEHRLNILFHRLGFCIIFDFLLCLLAGLLVAYRSINLGTKEICSQG
ncbi:unnamed protein product [Periconia digitata]|uniref:Uncharacterized protein n=1 Tax=Periconia digitata TaxID=1303443 RepID=A0A9W4UEX5_9PLEO|nr:unnamed protein product [Periconia digitata]